MYTSYHGWIGIPTNFLYKNTSEVDKYNLRIRNEAIKWNSKYGEQLEKSLVMTDDEKQFGLTRAILQLRNYNYIHDGFIPASLIIGFYSLGQEINRRYNLYRFPTAVSTNCCSTNPFMHLFNLIVLNCVLGSCHSLFVDFNIWLWRLYNDHGYHSYATRNLCGQGIS